MKKTYKSIKTFIVLLSLVAFNMEAQISGTVTINSGAATAGTNYQTWNALASALSTNTLVGPLTVNVVANSGPYNEQVIFGQIPGMSAANRITVNGNNNQLIFNSTALATPHTLLLSGADYMTFNNLRFEGQGTTYAMVCVLTGAANYNEFNNCTMTAPLNGTSSYQVPFCITSSSTSPTSGGTNSGNYNTVNTCTLSNGYYGCVFYGLTGAPYQQSNSLLNSIVTDFYYYGFYFPYQQYITVKNNIIQRPTRTSNPGACYGFAGWYQSGAMVDGNIIRNFFGSQLGASCTVYAMYVYYNSISGGPRNTWRNNIITNIQNNSTVYGFYNYYGNSDIYNNTFDFDYAACTSGTIYGLYAYGGAGYNNAITNNIVTCNRGASNGTKYALYFGGVTGNLTCERNIINISGNTGGSNYYGYYSGPGTMAGNMQVWASYTVQGVDATSYSVSPTYSNQALFDV